MGWNKDLPASDEKLRTLAGTITDGWDAIQEADETSGTAIHQKAILLGNRTDLGGAADPTVVGATNYLYSKDDEAMGDQEFFLKDAAANEVQLTNAGKLGATDVDYEADSISFDGTTTYNENNFITHWATVSAAGTIVASSGNLTVALAAGTYTMTFGAAVTNANYGVVATVENTPGNPHTANYDSRTTTEFIIRQANQASSNVTDAFTVMVIGAFPA